MPKKGYKSITIKEELYDKVSEKAESENKSIAKKTTELLTQDLEAVVE